MKKLAWLTGELTVKIGSMQLQRGLAAFWLASTGWSALRGAIDERPGLGDTPKKQATASSLRIIARTSSGKAKDSPGDGPGLLSIAVPLKPDFLPGLRIIPS
jgi:hypothetical protein